MPPGSWAHRNPSSGTGSALAPIALTAAYRQECAPRPMPERITQRESAAQVAAGGSDTAGNDGVRLRCGRPGCLRGAGEFAWQPPRLCVRCHRLGSSISAHRVSQSVLMTTRRRSAPGSRRCLAPSSRGASRPQPAAGHLGSADAPQGSRCRSGGSTRTGNGDEGDRSSRQAKPDHPDSCQPFGQ